MTGGSQTAIHDLSKCKRLFIRDIFNNHAGRAETLDLQHGSISQDCRTGGFEHDGRLSKARLIGGPGRPSDDVHIRESGKLL